MLAVARDGRLFLRDEPHEGRAPQFVRGIERIVEEVKRIGITTIIVEPNALAAFELADRAIIVAMGQVVYAGTARAVLDNRALRDACLAVSRPATGRRGPPYHETIVLRSPGHARQNAAAAPARAKDHPPMRGPVVRAGEFGQHGRGRLSDPGGPPNREHTTGRVP